VICPELMPDRCPLLPVPSPVEPRPFDPTQLCRLLQKIGDEHQPPDILPPHTSFSNPFKSDIIAPITTDPATSTIARPNPIIPTTIPTLTPKTKTKTSLQIKKKPSANTSKNATELARAPTPAAPTPSASEDPSAPAKPLSPSPSAAPSATDSPWGW